MRSVVRSRRNALLELIDADLRRGGQMRTLPRLRAAGAGMALLVAAIGASLGAAWVQAATPPADVLVIADGDGNGSDDKPWD